MQEIGREGGNRLKAASRAALQLFFLLAIGFSVLARGMVDYQLYHPLTGAMAIIFFFSLYAGRADRVARASLSLFVGMVFGLILLVAFQVSDTAWLGTAASVWSISSDVLGAAGNTISIAPADTLETLPLAILPLMVFMTTILLFRGDRAATAALATTAVAIAVLAVFAILEYEFMPGSLLLGPKLAYRDSLTAPFVNRNTAAALYGCNALVCLGLCFHEPVRVSPRGRSRRESGALRKRLVIGIALGLSILAMFMTKSRAGSAFPVLAGLGCGLYLFWRQQRTRYKRLGYGDEWKFRFRQLPPLRTAGTLLLLAILLAMLSANQMFRSSGGVADGRFCIMPGLLRMAWDNMWFGTGLGTFQMAFTPYRPDACGFELAWDRAHNFFLEGFITLGIGFVPLALAALGFLISTFWRGTRTRHSYRWAPVAGLGVTFAITAHNLLDFTLQIPGFAVYAALNLALLARLSGSKTGASAVAAVE